MPFLPASSLFNFHVTDCTVEHCYMISRLAMQTVRKVHTLGITQNLSLELRHFVMKDSNVLLVDFSRALTHQCNAVPVCSNQHVSLDEEDGLEVVETDCSEVMAVGKENMRAVSVSPSIEDCAILMS
jgi:hypothetical protein